MSPLPTFLRVPHPQGPVLVRVTPRSSTKSLPLDLELRATDDVRAFVLARKSGPFTSTPVNIYSLQVAPANLAWWAASGPASRPPCGPSSSCSLTPCANPFSLPGPHHGLQTATVDAATIPQVWEREPNSGRSLLLTRLQCSTARSRATGGRTVLCQRNNGSPA